MVQPQRLHQEMKVEAVRCLNDEGYDKAVVARVVAFVADLNGYVIHALMQHDDGVHIQNPCTTSSSHFRYFLAYAIVNEGVAENALVQVPSVNFGQRWRR
jgi:hypothetical protein